MPMIRDDRSESLPRVAELLSVRVDQIRLLSGRVMIECNEEQSKIGSLYVPLANASYPTSGWVVATGDGVEDVSVGDFVLLEDHGEIFDSTYYDVFEIILRDNDGSELPVWAEVEVEPVVREQVYKFRRGFGDDNQIAIADKRSGVSIAFNCSDVLSWTIGQVASPGLDTSYVAAYMIILSDEDSIPRMYYITSPSNILATVEY